MRITRLKLLLLRHTLIKIALPLTIILVFLYLLNSEYKLNNVVFEESVSPVTQSEKFENFELFIHIGVVIIDYNLCVDFHTVLKSILFYRRHALHFHIIVDDRSKNVLKTLFETWKLEKVIVTFYERERISIQGLENFRLNEAVLKFVLPTLVMNNKINKIAIVENNKIISDSVYKLWTLIDSFGEKQSIGIVRIEEVGESINRQIEGNEILIFRKVKKTKLHTHKDFKNNIENLDVSYRELRCQRIKDNQSCYDSEMNLVSTWDDFNPSENRTSTFFADFDGSLLKSVNKTNQAGKERHIKTVWSDNTCSEYFATAKHTWRTLLFVRKYDYDFEETDVSIVSQLSFNRMSAIEKVASVWDGPMSLTVYLSDSELGVFRNFIDQSKVLKDRFNIAFHVVFKENLSYPINVLRNHALKNAGTPYVLLLDIDFIPSKNLYVYLKSFLSNVTDDVEKKAFIVPAFESKKLIPSTKEELLNSLNSGAIIPFHEKHFKPAHAPTNFSKWKGAEVPYQVKWKREFEPYVVVKNTVTEYDTRFFGYGWNKVSHIMELEKQGYLFIVLPDGFVVHLNHKFSEQRRLILSRNYVRCLRVVKNSFISEINAKYKNAKRSNGNLLTITST